MVLHVDGASSSAPPAAEWQAGGDTAAELIGRLNAERLSAVRILDVPNSRLARDLAAVQALWSTDDTESVGDLKARIAQDVDAGVDPEAFWKLADEDYDVRVGSSPYSVDGRFDVTLAKRGQGLPSLPRSAAGASRGPIATDPMAAAYLQQLGLELGNNLRQRLPEPMVPAAVIALHEMPSGRVVESPGIAADALHSQMVEG